MNEAGSRLGELQRNETFRASQIEHSCAGAGAPYRIEAGHLAVESPLAILQAGNSEPALSVGHEIKLAWLQEGAHRPVAVRAPVRYFERSFDPPPPPRFRLNDQMGITPIGQCL